MFTMHDAQGYLYDYEPPSEEGLTVDDILHEHLSNLIVPRMNIPEVRDPHYLSTDDDVSEREYCMECAIKIKDWLVTGNQPSGHKIEEWQEHPVHWIPCAEDDISIVEYWSMDSESPCICHLCGVRLEADPCGDYFTSELSHFEHYLPATANEWYDLWIVLRHGFDCPDVLNRLLVIASKAIEAEWNHPAPC